MTRFKCNQCAHEFDDYEYPADGGEGHCSHCGSPDATYRPHPHLIHQIPEHEARALAHREATHARLYRFLRDHTPLVMLQFIAVHSDTPEEFDAALAAYMVKHEAALSRLNPARIPGAPEAPQGELF